MSTTVTMSATQQPQNANTTLYYYNPEDGVDLFAGTVSEKRKKHTPVQATINDMRGREQDFSLDKQGFQLVQQESVEKTFDDESRIRDLYYKECADIVRRATGASRVEATSHIIRRLTFEEVREAEKDLDSTARTRDPATVNQVHTDQSYIGAQFLKEPDSRAKRWAIINLWRPIAPVLRNPLAMMDARSVQDSELKELQVVLPTARLGEKDYYVGPNATAERPNLGFWGVWPPKKPEEHRWWYASNMQPDEALLFKNYDSQDDGSVARRTPHSAFVSDEDRGPARQSLEVRCVVYWDD